MDLSAPPIRVFLACPGDLAPERRLFFEMLESLDCNGRRFAPLGYEQVLAHVGGRLQDEFNALVDDCDVLVAAFHRRWGATNADGVAVTSRTQEEFDRALRRFNKTGSPHIICLFKEPDVEALADPGPQLQAVTRFRERLEQSGVVLYRTFRSEDDFASDLRAHLDAFAQGRVERHLPSEPVILPISEDFGHDLRWQIDWSLARQASIAASNGHHTEAARLFAALSQSSVCVPVIDVAAEYFRAVGHSQAVEALLDRKVALLRDRRLAARQYCAVMQRQGWLDELVQSQLVGAQEERQYVEPLLRQAFNDEFVEDMVDTMAQHFTLGELRTLVKFYGGEGATVTAKMPRFMGEVLPPFVQRHLARVLAENGLN